MTEIVQLSPRELQHAKLLTLVAAGQVSVRAAAAAMGLSVRQARRRLRRFEQGGAAGLAHGNRGRPAANRIPPEVRARILTLVQERYVGFNDTHLQEVLAEREGLQIGRETLRTLLREGGVRAKRRRRAPQHRRRRTPRSCCGMMIQWDGSHHHWCGPEYPRWVLMAALDDADGRLVGALFTPTETGVGYLQLLDMVLKGRGIPQSIYQDRHGALRRNDGHWSLAEQLAGEQEPTQVGCALRELAIKPIYARSPQGKGRVERFFGVAQDRLIAELRSEGITTIEAANDYLQAHWVRTYNRRFGRAPKQAESAYRTRRGTDLHKILALRYVRTVRNDNTVHLGDVVICIPPGPRRRSYARAKVEVRQHLDGTWSVYYQDKSIAQHEATPLLTPTRARIRTRHTRPAKGAEEAVLVYFIPSEHELAHEVRTHG